MQESTWICTYQMESSKFMSLLPPTCVLLFVQKLKCDPSILLPLDYVHTLSSPLSSHTQRQFHIFHLLCHHISKDNFISLSNFSPFVINNHKGTPLLIQRVVLGVDDWILNLHFWWAPPYVGMTQLVAITCGSMKIILKCHM
jgi:hypothetical protein